MRLLAVLSTVLVLVGGLLALRPALGAWVGGGLDWPAEVDSLVVEVRGSVTLHVLPEAQDRQDLFERGTAFFSSSRLYRTGPNAVVVSCTIPTPVSQCSVDAYLTVLPRTRVEIRQAPGATVIAPRSRLITTTRVP